MLHIFRSKRLASRLGLTVASCLSLVMTGPSAAEPAYTQPSVGINLIHPADWNTELPFVNVFHMSRPWISQRDGAGWGQGPALVLDEHGYPTQIEPGAFVETPLCLTDGHYPKGQYTVFYEGQGELAFKQAKVVSEEPGKIVIACDPDRYDSFWLQVRQTDPEDHLRNIRVVMPGFADHYAEQVFTPHLLDLWRGMSVIRYMDWMQTNGSQIKTWDDRPKVGDATWSKKGVPLEIMIELSNRLQIDPWFCMPHEADDDYVRQFAEMVNERLDPELRAYVEYSNEVWNGQFSQNRYAAQRGIDLGLADKPWVGAWHYTARRSVEIFKIWEEAFGDTTRFIRVLPSQAANPYVAKQVLKFEDAYRHADVLAIAPYMSFNVKDDDKTLKTADVVSWSVEQALDYMESVVLPDTYTEFTENKAVAEEHGLALVSYEAGQHMVGVGNATKNEALTKLLNEVNRHPRIGDIYMQYLNKWADSGGGVMAMWNSVGTYSRWGSWGLLEIYDQAPTTAPKYMAVKQWASSNGQDVVLPGQASLDREPVLAVEPE